MSLLKKAVTRDIRPVALIFHNSDPIFTEFSDYYPQILLKTLKFND